MKNNFNNSTVWCLVILIVAPVWAVSPDPNAGPVFSQEELDQILAPIALYPDSLLSQILMASTYPLEIIQADRLVRQNKDLKDEALAASLEKETWDPSVKSLVNFPQVLTMMSEKLDWTQKLGDAFLAQQKDVMDTIQKLRKKAQEQGNLNMTEQQIVKTEPNVIIIESLSSEVIYVPMYDPTEVYGTWWYPEYPPYYYYPPGYVAARGVAFTSGVVLGAAWGHAWGHTDWHGGNIDIDVSRNLNLNQNINRGVYAKQYSATGKGAGVWQHNPANRKGVAYRDQATAQKFNRASTSDAIKSREAFRGRSEQGRQDLARGDADTFKDRQQNVGQREASGRISKPATRNTQNVDSLNRGNAFQGVNQGSSARNFSSRGSSSRQSMSRPSSSGRSRPSGGGGRR
ncbi:MAG: hypothetical protein A2Y12_01610 [Planctomycetes bacterium GWF2_42_9]|nr:MAG: hypothetical protein A2Y12_01610 [Planctomycetes bacterium GWF2_42_9]